MDNFLSRFALLVGNDKLEKLSQKNVILFGVGGVGGAVAEMLVRSGIFNLTIVDFDKVDESNINRQVVALHSTIGKFKVDVLKDRLIDINPKANIVAIKAKLTNENIEDFSLNKFDYVIDCIDDISAKKQLIFNCYKNDIKLIVSCGAGNRYRNTPNFEVCDIFSTNYDKLAKLIRKFCSEQNIKRLDVAFTREPPIKLTGTTVGSVVYVPVAMACAIVSKVINSLL